MAILAILGRGGAVIGLVMLIIALLKHLILLVGVLLGLVKLAIIVAFVAVLIMIGLAIFRDRSRRKHETSPR